MTKEEIAELIDKMPQDMDVNDFIHELVNRALAMERKWVGLTEEGTRKMTDCWRSSAFESRLIKFASQHGLEGGRTHEPRVHSAN
jgi:hypothetical protein